MEEQVENKIKMISKDIPFGKANTDSLNLGVLDKKREHLLPQYVGHIDDYLYVKVKEFLQQTFAYNFELEMKLWWIA